MIFCKYKQLTNFDTKNYIGFESTYLQIYFSESRIRLGFRQGFKFFQKWFRTLSNIIRQLADLGTKSHQIFG
jgi:hypothetical protein